MSTTVVSSAFVLSVSLLHLSLLVTTETTISDLAARPTLGGGEARSTAAARMDTAAANPVRREVKGRGV